MSLISREVEAGDDSTFAGAIYPSLLSQARQWVGYQLAEDLVQETFCRWYRHRARGGHPLQPGAYLRATMRNLAINRATRAGDLLDHAASIEDTPWLV